MPEPLDYADLLPPDIGGSADVALLVDLLGRWSRVSCSNPAEASVIREVMLARSPELEGFFVEAVKRYANRASDALTEVDPRLLKNISYIEAAMHGVRGAELLRQEGWRRELWTIAAGGAGTRKSGRALRRFVQASLDYRSTLMMRGWLGLDGAVTSQDHDFLIPGRARFAWVARRVSHLLIANSDLPDEIHDALDSLWAYTHQVCNGEDWSFGCCQEVPLTPAARALAAELSIRPGSLAGTPYPELLTTRRSETHPYVIIDGVVLPARADAAQLKLENAVFALIRRKTSKMKSAESLEGTVREIMTMIPGLDVQAKPVFIRIDEQNPGETDVFATNPDGRAVLGEVKAHVTVEGLGTTDKSHAEGIDHLARQLRKRRNAYRDGQEVRLFDGAVANRRRVGDPLTFGATLHEYSGALWRSSKVAKTAQTAPADTPVFSVGDLQLVAAVVNDADDFYAYLETRERVFSREMAHACDELDILCWYLRRGAAGCAADLAHAEGGYWITFAPTDVPICAQVAPEPSSAAELRQVLLSLPPVAP